MIFRRTLFSFVVITVTILVVLVGSGIAQGTSITTILEENFNDGDVTNNPTWEIDPIYAGTYAVIGGELHSDGAHIDGSDRYLLWYVLHRTFEVPDYLELSFKATLKSAGNPQAGRGVLFGISAPDYWYSLRIERGYTNGPSVNPAISLSIDAILPLNQVIIAPEVPQYDQPYAIRAVRENGTWTLYVNGVMSGTAVDYPTLTHFESIIVVTVGSVIVDDVIVRTGIATLTVAIDIKPGSDPNCINNNDHGVIPVAILGSATFDVTQIAATTVRLESLAVRRVGKQGNLQAHIEDVNGDGFSDLMVQFEDSAGAFAAGQTTATLTGNLYDGTPFQGTDSICLVP